MGTQIGRIEKEVIFSKIIEEEITVNLHAYRLKSEGKIAAVADDHIVFQPLDGDVDRYAGGQEIRIFFAYYDHVMTFDTTVLRIDGPVLKLSSPKTLYRNLQRKYERILNPRGLDIFFFLEENKVYLNFPRSEEYDDVNDLEYSEEFKVEQIDALYRQFREKAETIASDSSITMFRNKSPESLEERIIAQLGKILFIPSLENPFPETDSLINGHLVTRGMLIQNSSFQVDDSAVDLLPKLLEKKKREKVISEIYCPIIYQEYVVGYLYLVNREDRKVVFSKDDLQYIHQFSRVLAHSLLRNGYFAGAKAGRLEYQAEIVDISASGLLFSHDSPRLESKFALYTDVELHLKTSDRRIKVQSRVMRKFRDDKFVYYGLQFLEIHPEDFRYLFEYIYGRKFTDEDDMLWEGGSNPPPISL